MSDLAFWGVNVPPKTPVPVNLSDDDGTDFVHVTNVALGPGIHNGPHTVVLKMGAKAFTLGTLVHGKVMQFPVDTILSEDAVFAHNGSGDVSITGYRAMIVSSDSGGPIWDDEPSDLEEEAGEEIEEDSDDEEVPLGIPIDARERKVKANGNAGALKPSSNKKHGQKFVDFGAESDDEDEDNDDDEDEDDEEEDSEDAGDEILERKRLHNTPLDAAATKKRRVNPPVKGASDVKNKAALGRPLKAPVPQENAQGNGVVHVSASKMKATQHSTPKGGQGKQNVTTPKTTEAMASVHGTPKDQEEFKQKIVNALRKNGPQSLENLGPKVSPKPKFVKKLGKFLAQYPDTFVLEAGAVKLK